MFLHVCRVREAKSLLQRTKILEKSLASRQIHLQHLEAMHLQIDSASDNQTVLCALAASGRALQQITGGTDGLTKVEDTVHDIADSIQDSNEVSQICFYVGSYCFDLLYQMNRLCKNNNESFGRTSRSRMQWDYAVWYDCLHASVTHRDMQDGSPQYSTMAHG